MIQMKAKYNNRCRLCGGHTPVGCPILYIPGVGAIHVECKHGYLKLMDEIRNNSGRIRFVVGEGGFYSFRYNELEIQIRLDSPPYPVVAYILEWNGCSDVPCEYEGYECQYEKEHFNEGECPLYEDGGCPNEVEFPGRNFSFAFNSLEEVRPYIISLFKKNQDGIGNRVRWPLEAKVFAIRSGFFQWRVVDGGILNIRE